MANEEKILKVLEELQNGQKQLGGGQNRIENRLDRIEQDQSHISH